MARIFLSYAHEDLAKAKSLAGSLERSGHSVWWDPQVGGATRFAAEIATALKDCEVVVVLWSQASAGSTWVQDEAAEGRDAGKLVPILLDDSRPPLGFRQFQAIDLSKWRGRGRVRNLAAIEGAIQTVLQGGTLAGPSEPPRRRNWASRPIAVAVALLLLIAIAVLYGTGRFASRAEAASLAVMPFADFSPKRDKAYLAEGVAEEIRTLLSDVPGIRVTGRSSTEMLGPTADFKQAHSRLGVTHMLEGSLRVDGQKLRLHVRLLRTTDGIQVWAEEFDRELSDIFAVQDQVGAAVAQRLRGTLLRVPLGRKSTRTTIQAFDLLLAGEAKWRQGDQGDPEAYLEAERLFKRATEIDPKYAPAWTARSRAMWVLIDGGRREGAWGPNWLRDRDLMLQYARRAVELDAKDADAQAWLGFVEGSINENPELALARIEKAIELNPGDRRVWGLASFAFANMCRHDKSFEAQRRYAALEPLDLYAKQDLMWELYAGGEKDEADALRRKLLKDPGQAKDIADTLARQQGDFSFLIAGRLKDDPGGAKPGVAHMLHALGEIEPAIAFLPSDYRRSLGAYWKRDYRQAAAASDWLREGYWDTARGFALTRALVRAGRNRDLLRLFDHRFGSIEVFDRRLRCDLPAVAAPVVSALRAEGRSGEAARLVQLAEHRFRQGLAQRYYDEDIYAGYVELLLVAGRREDALAALEQAAQRTGLRQAPPPMMRLDLADPVFDPIRGHPRFKAVERRIAAWRAKELRELAAAGVRL